MARYKVILKPSVEKDLRSLPREVVARVFKRIETLRDDPLPRHSVKSVTSGKAGGLKL